MNSCQSCNYLVAGTAHEPSAQAEPVSGATAGTAVVDVPEIPTALAAYLMTVEAPEVRAALPTSPMVSMGLSPTMPGVLECVAVWLTDSSPPASALCTWVPMGS